MSLLAQNVYFYLAQYYFIGILCKFHEKYIKMVKVTISLHFQSRMLNQLKSISNFCKTCKIVIIVRDGKSMNQIRESGITSILSTCMENQYKTRIILHGIRLVLIIQ